MPVSARWIKSALSLSVVLALLLLALPVLAGPSAQTSGPTVVINTGALNQRTGPGLEYAIQGAVPGGSEWPVVGRTADRSWWEISTDIGIGWVNNEYVVTRGSFRGI